MTWVKDVLFADDGTLITVIGSSLEIRGEGWERRKRPGDTPYTDRPRIANLLTPEQARRVAELLAGYCMPKAVGEAQAVDGQRKLLPNG